MSDDTRILYNADCPVCSFEINRYANRAKSENLPLKFEDLNTYDAAPYGITNDQAARRMHVLHQDKVYAGMDGFIVLWQQIPHLRWLARLCARPVIKPITDVIYDRIVAPIIYRWHLRRQAKRTGAT